MGLPVPAPISDGDRERVAELLQQACGDGRITLEEFSVRVGAAWAATSKVKSKPPGNDSSLRAWITDNLGL